MKKSIFVLLCTLMLISCSNNRFEIPKEEGTQQDIAEPDIYKGNLDIPIDYDFIKKEHEILEYNIAVPAGSVYDHFILSEFLKDELEKEAEFNKEFDIPWSDTDYFLFDFNDDGLEDYVVCFHGNYYSGTGFGNYICIYLQEEDGTLEKVDSVVAGVYEPYMENEHAPIAVLNEKTGGCYAFVLPWTQNRVRSYNEETKTYGTYQYADEEESLSRWE